MDSDGNPTAGSIVWVRRRNGSWWPGKILCQEELPLSNLTSPRSGTPVKLLGREDASVDWYNLEKSKRVKVFRCGEFDDCIERAESAKKGMPIKKREKYARREDAILHALELEKEILRKQGKLGTESDMASKPTGPAKAELGIVARSIEIDNRSPGNTKRDQLRKQLDSSEKDESISHPQCLQKAKDGNLPGCEDDHSDVTLRMRGLQDLGLETTSSKRKSSSSDASDDSRKLTVCNNSHALSNGVVDVGRPSRENGEEHMGGNQAKRCRGVQLRAGSSDTSDGKEVPLGQVEMLSSQMEDGDSHFKENASESLEETESDFSRSESSESDSDSSKTEQDTDEEMTDISGPTFRETEVHAHGRYEALQHGNVSIEESDESGFSGDLPYHHDQLLAHENETVSKWKLKGKRNTRNLPQRPTFLQRAHDYNDSVNERDRMVGLDNMRYMYTSGEASRGQNRSYPDTIDWDRDSQHDLRGHWDPRFVRHGHFGVRTKLTLIDVDLQVQPSYQKARDPIISLTSKLDGKAIIGHSINIGVVEDGSFENLFPTHDYFGNDVIDHDGNTALPPPWRTARRTNSRVPRPRTSSVCEVDDVDYSPFMDQERKLSFKRLDSRGIDKKTSLVGKSQPHSPRLPVDNRSSRKSRKRGNSLSNQKTRTLLSISIEQNHSTKPMHNIKNSQIDGLIKPGPTTVACIPVKLVFSRLLEKINRPPSKTASKVVLANGSVERTLL